VAALLRERGADVRGASRRPGPGEDVFFDWNDPGSYPTLDGAIG
jgi:uncharacterized protein YbjT (DUF2867 family)